METNIICPSSLKMPDIGSNNSSDSILEESSDHGSGKTTATTSEESSDLVPEEPSTIPTSGQPSTNPNTEQPNSDKPSNHDFQRSYTAWKNEKERPKPFSLFVFVEIAASGGKNTYYQTFDKDAEISSDLLGKPVKFGCSPAAGDLSFINITRKQFQKLRDFFDNRDIGYTVVNLRGKFRSVKEYRPETRRDGLEEFVPPGNIEISDIATRRKENGRWILQCTVNGKKLYPRPVRYQDIRKYKKDASLGRNLVAKYFHDCLARITNMMIQEQHRKGK